MAWLHAMKAMFAPLWLCTTLFLISLVNGSTGNIADDPYSSEQLGMALDASITRLFQEEGSQWFNNLKAKYNYQQAVVVASCTPDPTKWPYPAKDTATGLLKRVLTSGELKVAGVNWIAPEPLVADYITNTMTPTGFWPEYLKAIVRKLTENYGTAIRIQRVYKENSTQVNDAVARGDVDMSEPYYYMNGFMGTRPRTEMLEFSCVTLGTDGKVIVSKTTNAGVTTIPALLTFLASSVDNNQMGFIGKGNYDSVSGILPTNMKVVYLPDGSAPDKVASGALPSAFISEGMPKNPERFNFIDLGTVSPRAIMLRKNVPTCDCNDASSNVKISFCGMGTSTCNTGT